MQVRTAEFEAYIVVPLTYIFCKINFIFCCHWQKIYLCQNKTLTTELQCNKKNDMWYFYNQKNIFIIGKVNDF